MDKYIIEKYGAKNLVKNKRNLNSGTAESKKRFVAKYPDADLSMFEFSAFLTDNGDIDKYTVYYRISDSESYDITSDTFRNNKKWVWYLYQWEKIWNIYGTVQPYVRNLAGTQHKIDSFRIYITNVLYFNVSMEDFSMDGVNAASNDINYNSYLAAIFAAYIATYSCGICTAHFEYDDETPRIITSIARYHLYYTMKRFIRVPSKMRKYITNDMRSIINRNRIDRYVWTDEFHNGKENLSWWISQQPPGTVRNARPTMSARAGQVGINIKKEVSYQLRIISMIIKCL